MKKIILIALLLSACKHTDTGLATPVQIPELPPILAKKAESLPQITDPSMGGLVVQGAEDDSEYNTVSNQLNKLIDFYNCIKVSINNKSNAKECLK